jgi:DNA-binding Lrp family transcriptional regulator
LKDAEARLISELMKNTRRSDRELKRLLGISQPTVGRMIRKLKEEGAIKEYKMIPDFSKLGYRITQVCIRVKPPLAFSSFLLLHGTTTRHIKTIDFAKMFVKFVRLDRPRMFCSR